jgi:hypothetical protein
MIMGGLSRPTTKADIHVCCDFEVVVIIVFLVAIRITLHVLLLLMLFVPEYIPEHHAFSTCVVAGWSNSDLRTVFLPDLTKIPPSHNLRCVHVVHPH